MSWLARILGMMPPEPEEEELENPSGTQSRLLPWKVVRNKRPAVWAITPRKLEDAVRAADRLIEGAAVFVNLQHIDSAKAQRIVDMLAGVSYALRGTFYEVGKRLFLFVPPNVPVGGDEETIKAISALFTGVGGTTESEIELPVR
ncbi:MAG: cell division protein SepF [Armatimonadetes bacterium]|nr:cell division protein SepF [Armatimonadota bacterium]MCX7966909.1 cell division protein SepF [Armatimonadota bacterium]MDW8141866.1 cell division protein SepF [Armatimonadota bacterium]